MKKKKARLVIVSQNPALYGHRKPTLKTNFKMVGKIVLATHRAARSREPEKERQEKEQVYIWPLFPSSFPLRKHILLLADCGGQYVCCTRERGL